ncbi:Uncharacterized protein dnm_041080 [Desulfonema magnum]|uniref:Uncharacterized protein n=1 Tax=Desulfonema magnum TaxID=45655 RepID=A0A975BMT7_9BACT|nr:Uncharacterized protein dnm_041080 [Desulfonema magnum]
MPIFSVDVIIIFFLLKKREDKSDPEFYICLEKKPGVFPGIMLFSSQEK